MIFFAATTLIWSGNVKSFRLLTYVEKYENTDVTNSSQSMRVQMYIKVLSRCGKHQNRVVFTVIAPLQYTEISRTVQEQHTQKNYKQ